MSSYFDLIGATDLNISFLLDTVYSIKLYAIVYESTDIETFGIVRNATSINNALLMKTTIINAICDDM